MGAGVSMFFTSRELAKKNEKQSNYVSLRDLLEEDQTSLSVTSCITSITSALCSWSWGSSPTSSNIGGVKKNEKQSGYVSLSDLLEKDQTSLSVTSCITWGSSPTKTEIRECGTYKRNLDDEKLSSQSFVSPYLNYPNDFIFSCCDKDENKEYVFGKIISKSSSKEGLKGKSNKNLLPPGIVETEDTMVEKVLKVRKFIEDLKVMLLEVMTTRLETNGQLRVHIVLEQVDSENEEKDNKNSKGKSVKLVTRRV